jgi:2-dehydro-3-deoxygluconokinase
VEAGGVTSAPAHAVDVVDTVGAGDAFVAGYLSARLRGWDTEGCLRLGNACGACAVSVPGDVESMPYERDALALLGEPTARER